MLAKKIDNALVDRLLLNIQRSGWTDRLAAQFQEQYSKKLQWQIVVQMEKLGFLQYKMNPQFLGAVSSRRLELYENTLSDLWIALLGDLVSQFIERVENDTVHQRFSSYVGGVIRHILITNARSLGLIPRETPAAIVKGICEAKQDATRRARIAWAKFCFEHRMRGAFLMHVPSWLFRKIYKDIHHLVDYFFEVFIPDQCQRLQQYRPDILTILSDAFVDGDFYLPDSLKFVGMITPYAADADVVGQVPADTSEDEYLSSMQHTSQRGSRDK
jgi:hypothetical protein